MITVGLSQHELNLITKILDEHNVEYHIGAAGEEETKVQAGRGNTSFYQIDINDEQFSTLSAAVKSKLENLGIYGEMEVPDFSEAEPVKKTLDPVKAKRTVKMVERIFIAAMLFGIVAFVRKVFNEQ
jgi:hypothetical protein